MRKIIAVIALLLIATATGVKAAGEPLVLGEKKWAEWGRSGWGENCKTDESGASITCESPKIGYIPVYTIGFYENGEFVEVATTKAKGEIRWLTEEEAKAEGLGH